MPCRTIAVGRAFRVLGIAPAFSRYLLLFSSGKIQEIEIDSVKRPRAPTRSA